MNRFGSDSRYNGWRKNNRPYLLAIVLAIIMVLVIAPEVNEGDAMSPTIKSGQVLIVSKSSYSPKRDTPERNKVVILKKTFAQDVSDDNIIARVAGLPGDKIQIKNGKVFINGEEYVTPSGIKGAEQDMKLTLKKDEVFLLCDNRDELVDSRNKLMGPVDMREIKGNVLFCIWPFSEFGGID